MEGAIQSFLLPSEEVKVVLEASIVHSPGTPIRKSAREQNFRRFLAVVSHVHAAQINEQGGLFIFKHKSLSDGQTAFVIDNAFLIAGDFSISMEQLERSTIDLRKQPSTLPRAELTIKIKPGQHADSIMLVTSDLTQLRSALQECRRLKKISDVELQSLSTLDSGKESRHSWILPYTDARSKSGFSAPTPSDVRISRLPVHSRLSPSSAGNTGDDAKDIQLIREEWNLDRARSLCNKNQSKPDIRIRIGSFNVNGKMPTQDLSTWVQGKRDVAVAQKSRTSMDSSATGNIQDASIKYPHDEEIDEGNADLLVLAFQELDLSTEALLYSTKTTREDAWTLAIFAGLGEKAQWYEKLASKQLVGMLLILIVKKRLKDCFSDIRTCTVGAGIMGLMGNKGATAIRVLYSQSLHSGRHSVPTSLTFVNSHLAAFDDMVERRNADYHDLTRRLLFQRSDASDFGDEVVDYPGSMSVFETDVLFWMGDLNYRVELPSEEIRTLLSWPGLPERNVRELLKFDQLNNAIRSGDAFDGFVEYQISHLPTYRFSPGLMTDELGYDVKRKPAWTDRILHMTSRFNNVRQLSYNAHAEISMSDHIPVSAEFVASLDTMELREYETTLQKLNEDVVDLEDLEAIPKVAIDQPLIDFGPVRYKRKTSKSLTVRNSGKIPCAFRFISLEAEELIHPTWLRVEPMTGFLLPEESMTVVFEIEIDNTAASTLNLFYERLDFTLILHTELGKDHFISVSAQYEPTCFANSLSHLARLPGPIRSVKSSKLLLSEDEATNAPKEVMRLVNWMMGAGVNMADLFMIPGDEALVDIIRECLDTGEEFSFPTTTNPEKIPPAFAETLVQFFNSLTESIIPQTLFHKCMEASSKDEALELLDRFPPSCVNVWISLTAFLHYVSQQSETEVGRVNRSKKLAAIFGPAIFREDGDKYIYSPLAKRRFLLFFIL